MSSQHFITGHYYKQKVFQQKGQYYSVMEKEAFLYKDSVVYPFIQHEEKREKVVHQ